MGDRLFLERNLEKLVAEQGISVIGELTQQMGSQQIEQLVRHMKEKLGSPDARGGRQPIDLASVGELSLDKFLSQLSLHQVGQGGVKTDRMQAPTLPAYLPSKAREFAVPPAASLLAPACPTSLTATNLTPAQKTSRLRRTGLPGTSQGRAI